MKLDLGDVLDRLNALQRAMGIEGATVTLTQEDLTKLRKEGIDVSGDEIVADPEGVLRYKGEAVVLYIRDQYGGSRGKQGDADVSYYKFHVADCRTLHRMRTAGRGERYVVSNRDDGLFPVKPAFAASGPAHLLRMSVCRDCLHKLDWDGYRAYIQGRPFGPTQFDIREFFRTYRNVRAWPPQLVPRGPPPPESNPVPPANRGWAPPPPPPPPAAPAPPSATPPRLPDPPVVWPEWLMAVPDMQMRAALLYIDQYGVLSEVDLTQMVGDARRVRRFTLACQDWTQQAPFRIQVTVHNGVRTFRRNPPRRGP